MSIPAALDARTSELPEVADPSRVAPKARLTHRPAWRGTDRPGSFDVLGVVCRRRWS
ncbi:hypothetical protein [Streptomyces sp. Ag109_G2-15]|uniref:hypothetical protein n=1 Tax=Streptomyces sp. Ag109_G2-15 TaxID=1938850 RepID=UPI0015D60BF3|nr:hypothetical protein [Streptomyces sp. Ag109_G2-15]